MKKKKGPSKPGFHFFQHFLSILVFFVLLSFLYATFSDEQKKPEEVSVSWVAQQVRSGEVEKIIVQGDKLSVTLIDETEAVAKKERESSLSETLVNYGVSQDDLSGVIIEVKNESGVGYWLMNLAPILFPVIFILLIFWFLSRQVKGAGGMQAFTFGQSKARIIDPSKQKINFKDVAGNREAKQELEEIVDFLRNPKKFLDIGAEIPKGVLLMGEPGTGKTLLARAVAGEAKVPFFHLSGSEFVEMFVGVDIFGNICLINRSFLVLIDEVFKLINIRASYSRR